MQSSTYCFRGFVIPIPLNRSLALEGKQLVSVVLVLLAACRDFGRETRLEGSGQGLEAVEDGDDTELFFQRWDWNFKIHHSSFISTWHFCTFRVFYVIKEKLFRRKYMEKIIWRYF